jgi:hypothetical protein
MAEAVVKKLVWPVKESYRFHSVLLKEVKCRKPKGFQSLDAPGMVL